MPSAVPFLLSLALSGLEPRASIAATWSDGHGLVPNAGDVRSEIEAILGSAGIGVRWTEGGPEDDSSLHVAVVVSPSEPSGAGWRLPPSAMGVYLSTAEASAVFVFYHRVARVLGFPPGRDGMMAPSDRKRLAKALGRVVVHELVHRIVPQRPHADSGLMRGDLGRSFLLRRSLELDEPSKAAVLSVLLPSANGEEPGPRSSSRGRGGPPHPARSRRW
jgi:hypothetical protein